jgi:site-specific recombinase XerD
MGEDANINHVHPHRFRVTRITNLIDRGMAIQNVQRLVGHNDISTTERYYRTNLSDVRYEYFKYCS